MVVVQFRPAKRDCELYRSYHEFAENLSASYRSRATLNEWGLYFAGLVAWSGLTASAGLAATNAGIQALRIVPLVSGFVSGLTALGDNKDKALAYTIAANKIDEAIDSGNQLAFQQKFYEAFVILSQAVTKAKNEVESKRAELTAKDKQLEELAEKIIAKLPKQFKLSDEDLDIPVGATYAIKVEDAASIDPTRTRISKPAIVDVS